jgi:hypothetical protein
MGPAVTDYFIAGINSIQLDLPYTQSSTKTPPLLVFPVLIINYLSLSLSSSLQIELAVPKIPARGTQGAL